MNNLEVMQCPNQYWCHYPTDAASANLVGRHLGCSKGFFFFFFFISLACQITERHMAGVRMVKNKTWSNPTTKSTPAILVGTPLLAEHLVRPSL